MSITLNPAPFSLGILGSTAVTKDTGTLAATTVALFTIAGGRVAVTSMFGLVTVDITVSNSYKLQMNPTTGDTLDIAAATTIGATDVLTGTLIGFGQGTTAAPALITGASYWHGRLVLPVGQIEHVSGGTDGKITWYVHWIPIDAGATLVAA